MGERVPEVKCPWCDCEDMHYDDVAETLMEMVKCNSCGKLTDFYEASKQFIVVVQAV